MSKEYTLRVTPLFERDFTASYDYIKNDLQNPIAAQRLMDDTRRAITERLTNPLMFEPYSSTIDRKSPYYPIRVRNYTVFYVVIDNVMEVRRFIYSKRDITKLL